MTSKQWLLSFALTALALALLLATFNVLTDPFGVFGDVLFDWHSYNATNNPRTAKIGYLREHFDDYDSYIIGCSASSSFPVETWNRYLDANFYNLFVYGADMKDTEQFAAYLLKHDEVKNLVLCLELGDGAVYDTESNPYTHSMLPAVDGSFPLPFYLRYLFANPAYGGAKIRSLGEDTWLAQSFDVFDEKTGAYDKKKRDAEPISDLPSYLKAYPVFADYPAGRGTLPATAVCMESVARIRVLCEEAGVNLIVVTAPMYADYVAYYDMAEVKSFYHALAEVTDFWDFSYSSVSFEPRYFYDSTHFRNEVGNMAIDRIFGGGGTWCPEDFGHYVTADNADAYFASYGQSGPMPAEAISCEVPILMYHHLAEEGNSVTTTPEMFEAHLSAMKEAGYTAVTVDALIQYVRYGIPLPEKPVCITFDDGYASNYEIAYPLLREYGMCASVFVIGVSVGKDTYKDTGEAILSHFGTHEMAEMVSSGVIAIGSHTYDLHGSESFGDTRLSMEDLEGEAEEDYLAVLREDITRSREAIEAVTGKRVNALAFPHGIYDDRIIAVLREEGIDATFSVENGVHTLVRGLPGSLHAMKRIDAAALDADTLLGRMALGIDDPVS